MDTLSYWIMSTNAVFGIIIGKLLFYLPPSSFTYPVFLSALLLIVHIYTKIQ